jgi:hypothetical protein
MTSDYELGSAFLRLKLALARLGPGQWVGTASDLADLLAQLGLPDPMRPNTLTAWMRAWRPLLAPCRVHPQGPPPPSPDRPTPCGSAGGGRPARPWRVDLRAVRRYFHAGPNRGRDLGAPSLRDASPGVTGDRPRPQPIPLDGLKNHRNLCRVLPPLHPPKPQGFMALSPSNVSHSESASRSKASRPTGSKRNARASRCGPPRSLLRPLRIANDFALQRLTPLNRPRSPRPRPREATSPHRSLEPCQTPRL